MNLIIARLPGWVNILTRKSNQTIDENLAQADSAFLPRQGPLSVVSGLGTSFYLTPLLLVLPLLSRFGADSGVNRGGRTEVSAPRSATGVFRWAAQIFALLVGPWEGLEYRRKLLGATVVGRHANFSAFRGSSSSEAGFSRLCWSCEAIGEGTEGDSSQTVPAALHERQKADFSFNYYDGDPTRLPCYRTQALE